MLSSQANPINRRIIGNTIGLNKITDFPPPNEYSAYFKIKPRTQIKFSDIFTLEEFDLYGFGDYVSIYSNYNYDNWLKIKTCFGEEISAYGIVTEDINGEFINPITGDINNAGKISVIDLTYFTYDISDVVWGIQYNAVNYQTNPSAQLGVGYSAPFVVQRSVNFEISLKNGNRAFHKFYVG